MILKLSKIFLLVFSLYSSLNLYSGAVRIYSTLPEEVDVTLRFDDFHHYGSAGMKIKSMGYEDYDAFPGGIKYILYNEAGKLNSQKVDLTIGPLDGWYTVLIYGRDKYKVFKGKNELTPAMLKRLTSDEKLEKNLPVTGR